jgi:hypothetical protein
MSWVIEEITTSTIGFIVAMVILSVVIGVGLYGYWIYANHVTLENYLWPIAEVLPYKGSYFLAIVNTGNEPFYVEQIYLKGGSVLTPSQAVNPNLNWCSVSNTKLMHNQWWCGEVNQLPVAVRICSALDPQVCVVAPVHGWETVTFNQATLGISNCPVLASVSDPYNAGWEVAWTMAGGSYSVSESTSYQWCIVPNYYPITINFQSTITSNPSNYQCQISPQTAQVNYEGKPETQSFTVTCQQQQQPPPPPPPPPPGGGGSVTMTLVINDNPGVSWTAKVDQYIAGAYWIVWEQSGSSSNTYSVNLAEGYQYAISVSVPSSCTTSGSPVALGSLFTATNSFTETVTITCQSTTPPPPPPPTTYGCFLTVQGQSNPSGIASVSVSPTSAFVPSEQSQPIGATAPLSTGSGADWYEFDHWSYSLSGPGSVSLVSTSTKSGNAFSTWQYMCPSGLTRNVTATLTIIANYDHDYIYLSGPTTISQGTTTAQYTLSWSVAPGSASQVQWLASVVSNFAPAEYQVSATLYYTEYGASLKGSSSLQATLSCTSGTPYLSSVSINPPSQSVSGSSGSATATVTINWQCNVNKGQPQ